MGQNVFHLEGPFRASERSAAEQFVSDYIYQGAFEVAAEGSNLFIHLEQIASRPCPLFRMVTAGEYAWRRTSAHIRTDGADFCVVRYLQSGQATITQAGRTIAMTSGDVIFNRSTMPIHVNLAPTTGTDTVVMLMALVPSAVLQEQIDVTDVINQLLPREQRHHRLLVDMLQLLLERASDIDAETGEFLGNAFFGEIGKLAASVAAPRGKAQGVSADRLSQIRSMIRTHFSNPNLSLELIAQKCGISPRYVSYVMRKFGSSFYDELKAERLNAARRILQSRPLPIKQVAYYTGFKSAAHFSAAYKREFGHPPSDEELSGDKPLAFVQQGWNGDTDLLQ